MSHGWEGWTPDADDPGDGADAAGGSYPDPDGIAADPGGPLDDPYPGDPYADESFDIDDDRYDGPGLFLPDDPAATPADPTDDAASDGDGDRSVSSWTEPVGADPQRVDDWPPPEFPEPLSFDTLPEPVDGWPWADPDLLGGTAIPQVTAAHGDVDPAELAGYAGEEIPADADGWAALAGSTDPATRALAQFWAPAPGGPGS